jgi:hypothetical protein
MAGGQSWAWCDNCYEAHLSMLHHNVNLSYVVGDFMKYVIGRKS